MVGRFSIQKVWLPWFVLAVTALLGLVVATALYRLEDTNHATHFELTVSERIHWLESGITLELRPLRRMAAVFGFQRGEISEEEFRNLAQSAELSEQPELLAIQWLAKEETPSGQELFPVHYSHTLTVGADDDPQNDPVPRVLLEQARQRRDSSLSPWYRAHGITRLRVVRPVFGERGGDQELLGFISGIYRVDLLLEAVLRPSEPISMDLFIADASADVPGYFHQSRRVFRPVGPNIGPFPGSRRLTRMVNLFGVDWRVIAVSQPGVFVVSPWGPLVIGIGGVLFGVILSTYPRMLLGREAQVRQLVELRTDELNRRTEQLQTMNAELENFAYIASHDLRAPLRAVSQLASSIEEDGAESMDVELIRRMRLMRERVQRMDDLIEGLLIYSRAGGTIIEVHDRVPLGPLLQELSDELPLPVHFRVEIRAPMPTLRGNALHLRQIFQNLIINAAAHHDHPESGVVTISAQDEVKFWHLDIADNGPGIPPDERERVFRMFASTGGKDGGVHAGIGLALVKKLVHGYGGRIDVIENQPRGARFRIWWPK